MTAFLIIPLAFLLGFALVRAATCTVAATMRWVGEGKLDWLFGLLIVASWAGLVLFLLLQYSGRAHIPVDIEIGWQLFFGAAIMGVGALINRGCFVGTVGYIGAGKFSYILTFVGLALAMLLLRVDMLNPFGPVVMTGRTPTEGNIAKQAVLLGFAVLSLLSIWLIIAKRNMAMLALLTVGITAALIYGTRPEWSYAAVLNSLLVGQGLSVGMTVELAVVALFAGAVFSSWLKNKFHPQFGTWKLAAANLAGGFLMGIGAAAVPGGNDVLLLWTAPGLTLYGAVAYLVMIATIAVMLVVMPHATKAMARSPWFQKPMRE
ncbi:YeeE/YedE thiosulfate transporter family protein [Parasphingorhabdus cellanae]|uniref:YeeE/YedE family protein n=1 Tax=Parasphingorhabdus cellanae TaxID=2806553 RepID=A0ABX7T0F9_9SPHN|nr:YeeE/YedE thiosulfate transporter family protein [Parasphingorhabdus cellanae]QTD55028.1 YeeE/YedE family protein [Parasphingorhabdus cellanae]